jgi:multidrug efflux pump subunit AcrB
VLSIAIAISMVVSLTATPMMCSRLLKVQARARPALQRGRAFLPVDHLHLRSALEVVLASSGAHDADVMALTIGVSVYLYIKIPKGFFPQQDTGRCRAQIQGQQHISFRRWSKRPVVRRTGPVRSRCRDGRRLAGAGSGGGGRRQFRPSVLRAEADRRRRKGTADEVIAASAARRRACRARQLFLQSNQDIRIGGRQSNAQYQYTLQTQDLNAAGRVGSEGAGRLIDASGNHRRQFRPAEFGLIVERGDRPRYRFASRSDRAGGRQRALRRLRPAPGLDDVQVDQSVSRGAGARAEVVVEPGLLEQGLRADAARH